MDSSQFLQYLQGQISKLEITIIKFEKREEELRAELKAKDNKLEKREEEIRSQTQSKIDSLIAEIRALKASHAVDIEKLVEEWTKKVRLANPTHRGQDVETEVRKLLVEMGWKVLTTTTGQHCADAVLCFLDHDVLVEIKAGPTTVSSESVTKLGAYMKCASARFKRTCRIAIIMSEAHVRTHADQPFSVHVTADNRLVVILNKIYESELEDGETLAETLRKNFVQAVEEHARIYWADEMIERGSVRRIVSSEVENVDESGLEDESQSSKIHRGVKIFLTPLPVDHRTKVFNKCGCGVKVGGLVAAEKLSHTSAPTAPIRETVVSIGETAIACRIDLMSRVAQTIIADRESGVGLIGQVNMETRAARAKICDKNDGVDAEIETDGTGCVSSRICVRGVGSASSGISHPGGAIVQETKSETTGLVAKSVLKDGRFVTICDDMRLPECIPKEFDSVLNIRTGHGPAVIKLMEAIVSICDPVIGNTITQNELHNALRKTGYSIGDNFGRNLQRVLIPRAYRGGTRGPNGGGEIIGLQLKNIINSEVGEIDD